MISFPRAMPTVGAMSQAFEPERVDFLSPEAGGELGAITAGFPRWGMRVSLNNMTFANADIWRAWLAVQRGAQRTFVAFDIDRRYPALYPAGSAFQASPTAWSQAINGDGLALLTLAGLNAGQVISIGDYIGFRWGAGRLTLARAVETASAAANGLVTVAIEPPVPPVVPADAAITLKDAGCLMRLVTRETKLAESGLGYFNSGSVIVAMQGILA